VKLLFNDYEIHNETSSNWLFFRNKRSKFRPSEIRVLEYLVRKRDKEATMKELCSLMPASTVSVTVDRLQVEGILEKVPKKSIDGSLYKIRLLAIPKGARSFLAQPIRRDVDVNSAFFMENIQNFQRIFAYIEADTRRELEGIETNYLIDFSEVHTFLNPDINHIYPSVGWIISMFEEKLKDDNYIFSPPSAWEMLHHLERTAKLAKKYSDFRILTQDLRMKKFLDVIKKPSQNPEQTFQKLIAAYKEMEELKGLAVLSNRELMRQLFRENVMRFKELVAQKLLVPLDEVLDDPYKYSLDSEVYLKALRYLMWRRYFASEKNVIDSMNMGLTYQLTSSLYKSDNQYFTLVTHSKRPLEIFYNVRWIDDPKGVEVLVREPSFMTTKILLRKEMPNSMDRLDYVKNGKDVTSYLWQNRDLLDYSDRFLQAFELNGERVVTEEYVRVAKLFKQIQMFEKKHVPIIRKILNINVAKIEKLKGFAAKDRVDKLKELLQDQEEYTNRINEAHETIIESVKETYKVLRNFVNVRHKHLLTPEMLDWLKELDEQF